MPGYYNSMNTKFNKMSNYLNRFYSDYDYSQCYWLKSKKKIKIFFLLIENPCFSEYKTQDSLRFWDLHWSSKPGKRTRLILVFIKEKLPDSRFRNSPNKKITLKEKWKAGQISGCHKKTERIVHHEVVIAVF